MNDSAIAQRDAVVAVVDRELYASRPGGGEVESSARRSLDTFLVRTLLVPALVLEIGDRVWWPSALARRTGTSTKKPTDDVAAETT